MGVKGPSDLDETNRQILTSFLSGGEGYAPQSGPLIGTLERMRSHISASGSTEGCGNLAAWEQMQAAAAATCARFANKGWTGKLSLLPYRWWFPFGAFWKPKPLGP